MVKKTDNRSSRTFERGNVFFTLFGAVAVVGVLGAGIMSTMRGPLSTMVEVNRRTQAESEMQIVSKVALLEAVNNLTGGGDCDSDTFIEPIEYASAGSSDAPTGGGFIPTTLGASKIDPWGTEYGYCAWDPGNITSDAGCGGGTANRLLGPGDLTTDYPVIAVISAGADKQFDTTCTGGASPAVTKTTGSDDFFEVYTYTGAAANTGGLWNIKTGDASTAEIAKNLEVTGNADITGDSSFSGLGAFGGLLSANAGLELPDYTLIDCTNAANYGVLSKRSYGAIGYDVNICTDAGVMQVVSGASTGNKWVFDDFAGSDLDIHFSSGDFVAIGKTDPAFMLDIAQTLNVDGAVTFNDTLSVDNNVVLGDDAADTVSVTGDMTIGTDGADTVAITGDVTMGTTAVDTVAITGITTIGATLDVTGATTLTNTLDVSGTTTMLGDVIMGDANTDTVTISGDVTMGTDGNDTLAVTGDVTIGTDGTDTVDITGDVTIGTSTADTVDIAGDLDVGDAVNIDGDVVLGDAGADTVTITGDLTYSGADVTDDTDSEHIMVSTTSNVIKKIPPSELVDFIEDENGGIGAETGLDADTVDNFDSSDLLKSSEDDTFGVQQDGTTPTNSTLTIRSGSTVDVAAGADLDVNGEAFIEADTLGVADDISLIYVQRLTDTTNKVRTATSGELVEFINNSGGPGSGLDADYLDSLDSLQYLRSDVDDRFGESDDGSTDFGALTMIIGDNDVLEIEGVIDIEDIQSIMIDETSGNMFLSREGDSNLFLGTAVRGALDTTGTGAIQNTVVGELAGNALTTGDANTMVGFQAGLVNDTGTNNNFIGSRTGEANVGGTGNNFIGAGAGLQNTAGIDNSFLGLLAGRSNTLGSENTFIGAESGKTWGTAGVANVGNVLVGHNAGYIGTGGVGVTGNSNVFLGDNSGGDHTSGDRNILLGSGVEKLDTAGAGQPAASDSLNIGNTLFGDLGTNMTTPGTGDATLTMDGNFDITGLLTAGSIDSGSLLPIDADAATSPNPEGVIVDINVGADNFLAYSGTNNAFLGTAAGDNITALVNGASPAGADNVAVGTSAGTVLSTGNNNTFLGSGSGVLTSTGDDNLFLGQGAGASNADGSRNIVIGAGADTPGASTNDYLNIGDVITGSILTTGTLSTTGSLTVGDAVSDILTVTGDMVVGTDGLDTVDIRGDVTMGTDGTDTVDIRGDVTMGTDGTDTVDINGDVTIGTDGTDTVDISGDVTIGDTLDVTGVVTMDSDVTLGDAAGDTITVNGTTTFNGPVNLSGGSSGLDIAGDLNVNGNTRLGDALSDTINLRGTINNSVDVVLINDDLDVDLTFNADGDVTMNEDVTLGDAADDLVTVTGDMVVGTDGSDTLAIASDVTIGTTDADTVDIVGDVTMGTGLTDTVDIAGDLTVDDVLTVNGNVVLGDAATDTVGVTGDMTIGTDGNNTLAIAGDVTIGTTAADTVDIVGDVTIGTDGSDTLAIASDVTIGTTAADTVDIVGDVTMGTGLTDTVDIAGDLTVDDVLTVNGNVVLGNAATDTVDVTGDMTIGTDGSDTLAIAGDVTIGTTAADTVDIVGDVTIGTNGSDTLAIASDVTIGTTAADTVDIVGDVTMGTGIADTVGIRGDLDVDDTLNVDGNVTLNANIDLGTAVTDILTIDADTSFTNTVSIDDAIVDFIMVEENDGTLSKVTAAELSDFLDTGTDDFLRSNVNDNYTSGTLTFDPGTTIDLEGTARIIDSTDDVLIDDGLDVLGTLGVTGDVIGTADTRLGNAAADNIYLQGTISNNNAGANGGVVFVNDSFTVVNTTSLNGAVNIGDAAGDVVTVDGTTTFNANASFASGTKLTIDAGAELELNGLLDLNNTIEFDSTAGDINMTGDLNVDGSTRLGTDLADVINFEGTISNEDNGGANNYNTQAGYLTIDDDVKIDGNLLVTGHYRNTSDERLKTDIRDLTSDETKSLLRLKTVRYKWKDGAFEDTETDQYGLLAQDVKKSFPELVSGFVKDGKEFLSVSYTGLISPIINAIRELFDIVSALQAENAALRGEVDSLKADIEAIKAQLARE